MKGKAWRALDSTLLDDAVATEDTVTQLVSMIRRVRAPVPAAAEVEVVAHDHAAGGKPACAWDDPAARDELVTRLVRDARAILDRLEDLSLDEDQSQLVTLLALVAGQDVEPDPDRSEHGASPGGSRVISTVDPGTRHTHKSRSVYRDGYKAHVAVEPDTGIITGVDLTPPLPRALATVRPAWPCWPARTRAWRCSPTPPTDPVRSAETSTPPGTPQ